MPVPGLDTKLIATVVRLSVHFLSYDEGVACLWIPQAKTCAETHRSDPGSDGPVDFRQSREHTGVIAFSSLETGRNCILLDGKQSCLGRNNSQQLFLKNCGFTILQTSSNAWGFNSPYIPPASKHTSLFARYIGISLYGKISIGTQKWVGQAFWPLRIKVACKTHVAASELPR